LPLEAGTQKAFADVTCNYHKNQFSEVTVSATVSPTSGSYASSTAVVIATLPAGYRPATNIRVPAVCCGSDGVFKAAFAFATLNGSIFGFPTVTATQIVFQMSFVADN
jgi:hypothetical protein